MLWPWLWTQQSNLLKRWWWCTTKQSLVAKGSALQKIQIKKSYFDDIHHHCDLDSKGSSFFHMAPWHMMTHCHTKFGYKGLTCSEDVLILICPPTSPFNIEGTAKYSHLPQDELFGHWFISCALRRHPLPHQTPFLRCSAWERWHSGTHGSETGLPEEVNRENRKWWCHAKNKQSKLGQFIALKSYGYALYHVQAIACLTICTVGMQLSDYQTHGQVSATHTDNASLSLTTVRKLHQQCTSMALSNLTSPQQIRSQQ